MTKSQDSQPSLHAPPAFPLVEGQSRSAQVLPPPFWKAEPQASSYSTCRGRRRGRGRRCRGPRCTPQTSSSARTLRPGDRPRPPSRLQGPGAEGRGGRGPSLRFMQRPLTQTSPSSLQSAAAAQGARRWKSPWPRSTVTESPGETRPSSSPGHLLPAVTKKFVNHGEPFIIPL